MSRPRRSDHTREALIQAGIQQISHHGYHGTGIKQILDIVNVPKGSFYNFFASKEAFVAEVIETYSHQLLGQLHEFIEGVGKQLSPKRQLESIYQYTLKKIADTDYQQSCLIGSMSTEVGAESAECRKQLKIATKKWVAFFVDRIEAGQQAGEFRTDISAEQLADVYWATWEGALIKLHMNKKIQPAKSAMDLMLNNLMSA